MSHAAMEGINCLFGFLWRGKSRMEFFTSSSRWPRVDLSSLLLSSRSPLFSRNPRTQADASVSDSSTQLSQLSNKAQKMTDGEVANAAAAAAATTTTAAPDASKDAAAPAAAGPVDPEKKAKAVSTINWLLPGWRENQEDERWTERADEIRANKRRDR